MNVPFRPIVSALFRNRAGALLVAAQVAIALAVLVNAVYMVKQRIDLIARPTGVDESQHLRGRRHRLHEELQLRLRCWMRTSPGSARIPGVIGVTATNSVPLSGGGSSDYVKLTPDAKGGRRDARELLPPQ